jgi:putative phage-type endonuclease
MTIIQQSPEWIAARLGRCTASRIADVMAKTKSGYSTSRANYCAQLVAERLTGVKAESYTNGAMQWGTDNEAEARQAYAFYNDVDVIEIGFVDHPVIPMSGASPDGLVEDVGLVEIKCPNTANHIETLISQKVPNKYILQMHWQMACTGREWCDFVSYDPRMPEDLRLFIRRVHLDAKLLTEITEEVTSFLAEVDSVIDKLNQLRA